MNIIERNYLPLLNMRDTQKAMRMIDEMIIDELSQKIEFVIVREPLISSTKVAISTTKEKGNRQINFDSSNDSNIYYIYDEYRYWLVNAVKSLDIKNNNAVATFAKFIDRDESIKNTQSMEKRKLFIEYRYDYEDQEKAFSKAHELNEIIYGVLRKVQKNVYKNFSELKGAPLKSEIDEKELRKISSKQNFESSLADVASEEGSFLLIDKRKPSKDRSIANTFALSLYSFKSEINEAYRIYKIQDRRRMVDIEPFISESESAMEEYIFGKEILKDNNIKTLSIEIDLDSLCLLLLQKSHILELQSGRTIDEIEKMLEDAEINHL